MNKSVLSSPLLGGYLYTELDGMSSSSTPAFCLLVKAPISLQLSSPFRKKSYTSDGLRLSVFMRLESSWAPCSGPVPNPCAAFLSPVLKLSLGLQRHGSVRLLRRNKSRFSVTGTGFPGSAGYPVHRVRSGLRGDAEAFYPSPNGRFSFWRHTVEPTFPNL